MRSLAASLLLVALASTADARREEPNLRRDRVPSAHTGTPVPVVVITPPSYDTALDRRYPVLYFLHDAQGDESILAERGVARELVAAMERKELPEHLIVSPKGSGTWWVDSYDGQTRMATFLSDELVPYVDL